MKLKRLLSLLLSTVLTFGLTACAAGEPAATTLPPQVDPVDDNFRSFYQVFVGSFSDSNGDGIGDLRGLINRLDYLNDGNIHSATSLGVQGLWLSPIFPSPSYHKYDAKDYYSIDWRFGSLEDLQELVNKCHQRNVKVILDLAINHTSSEHPWFLSFKEARAKGNTEDPYYDFYSCVTESEKVGGVQYQKIAGVDCWFECNFSGSMPELNFDNPTVREEALKIAKFYLDMGIDGFRFDAIKYIYYGDTARSAEFWDWYMTELRAVKPDIYCVGECWSGDSEVLEYYGAMNCFNFTMSQAEGILASAAKGSAINKYTNYVQTYREQVLEKNPEGMVMPFLSNHDMDRSGGFFITENHTRMAANLYLLCSGSPVIYYGEELGMRGSRGGENTDANRRLAMLWGDEDLIRDPEGSTYAASKQITSTVKSQLEDEGSMLHYYRRLLDIRHKYEAIARGAYTAVTTSEKNLGGFLITHGDQQLVLLHNTAMEPVTYDLAGCKGLEGLELTLADYIGCGSASLEGTLLTIGGQTSVILN